MDAEPVTPDAFLIFRSRGCPRGTSDRACNNESPVLCRGRIAPLADTCPACATPGCSTVAGDTPAFPKEPETQGPV